MTLWKNLVVALVAAFALAACSSSSDTAAPTPPDPGPSAYKMAEAEIAEATSKPDAQQAYDDVKDDVTAAEGALLQAAVDARVAELDMMNQAEMQKAALMTAAGMIDTSDLSTAADIAAANAAIAALEVALEEAAAVSDADKAMYQVRVTAAETAVADAQSALDHAAQTMALTSAVEALRAIDLGDLSSEEATEAAEAAIAGVQMALDAATELSAAEKAVAMTLLAVANQTVMAAQDRMDVAGQRMALAAAVAALRAIDFDDLMTQAQIDAANAAIIALDLALNAADDLTDAEDAEEKLAATVDNEVAKRKVASAKETLTANIDTQRTALTEAGTALGELDLDDLSDQTKIDEAQAAVDALKMALEGATHLSDDEKAMYQTRLDTATETVRVAETGMELNDRMTEQRTAIETAADMAATAVAGVSDTSTDSEVAAADAAVKDVKDAIAAAEDLSEDDDQIIEARAVLRVIEPLLANAKTSRTAYLAKKGDEDMKANADLGKAMHAALAGPAAGGNALVNLEVRPPVFAEGGDLTINAAAGAGSLEGDPDDVGVMLEAGASAGALGSWNGMDYAHSTGTGDAKVTNEARVYTNEGPGTSKPFAEAYTILPANDANAGSVLLVNGGVPQSDIELKDVMAAAFEHDGERNHPIPSNNLALKVRGTFDGARGEFSCTGTCTSTNDGSGAPSALGGTWHFKPDTGVMVNEPDPEYLYYGWWVSKDKNDMPTAASAFAGVVEGTAGSLDRAWTGAWSSDAPHTGSATYAGNAVGKFAMNNPLDSTGNGGHFTADAMLSAKFSGDNPGVTGTIDNFRLNDAPEDQGWSVSLALGAFGDDGAIAPVDDDSTGDVNESMNTTVWSINGNKAPASGTWSGTMYDEMPGNSNDTPPGDDSNIPTTVTGTFYSEFSAIGRMVGAFGADKQ